MPHHPYCRRFCLCNCHSTSRMSGLIVGRMLSARRICNQDYFLPVSREDAARFLSQMDEIADDAEDFAVVATLRVIRLPAELGEAFMALVDKVLQVSAADSLVSPVTWLPSSFFPRRRPPSAGR